MAGPAKNRSERRTPVRVVLGLPDDERAKGAPLAVYAFSQGGLKQGRKSAFLSFRQIDHVTTEQKGNRHG